MKYVLVVDDHPLTVKMVSAFLREAGYEAVGATDTKQAVHLTRQKIPDAVVSDILMPVVDGFDFLKMIRSNTSTAHVPMIMISSLSGKKEIRRAMNLGADDYLVKPIQREALLETLKARLERGESYHHQVQSILHQIQYNISTVLPHELRTPLSAIIGCVSLFETSFDYLEKADVLSLIETMTQSVTRMSRTIEEMLLYSKLELLLNDSHALSREREQHTSEYVSIISDSAFSTATRFERQQDIVIHNCVQQQKAERRTGGTLKTSERASIAISEHYLHVIIEQLIDNACKYSLSATSIDCTITNDNKHIMISISDEGRGMTAEQILAIGAFVQFDREYFEQQGVGLGLAVIKKIMHLINGSVDIHSIVGIGTTVTIYIPFHQE
jgi:two-component system, sensor histidine kinase and response regulator